MGWGVSWRRCLGPGLAVLALACGCSTSVPDASAPPTAAVRGEPAGTIVVEGGAGDGERLYLLELRQGAASAPEPRRLTDKPAYVARISASGRYVAYVTDVPEPVPGGDRDAMGDVVVRDLTGRRTSSLDRAVCPSFTASGDLVIGRKATVEVITTEGDAIRSVGPVAEPSCGLQVGRDRYVLWSQSDRILVRRAGKDRVLAEFPGCGLGPVGLHPDNDRCSAARPTARHGRRTGHGLRLLT